MEKCSNDNTSSMFTPAELISAVQCGDYAKVVEAVERSGFAADFRDSEDCTLLHWAAINNRLKIAEYLISKSADVNAVGGSNREIPLQWCVRQHGCVKLVQLLIDAGSDLHHKSVYNLDSLFIAVQCGHVYGTYILLCSGANPNTVNARGDTPLYWLIKNQIENVRDLQRLLLRFGSSVSHQNGQGNNAMHVVAETNVVDFDFLQTALLIYKSVLDPNSLMVKNNAGLTPQEVAKAGNRFMVTQFFVDVVLYTSLPECSSVISNALSVVALFLCLHLGGWFVGLPSYGIVWFVLDKNSQSTIVSKASRSSLGFAWGVITCVVSCAFAYLIPYFSFSATVLVVILVFLICYTLYRSSTTLPQHLSKCDLADRHVVLGKVLATDNTDEDITSLTNSVCIGDDRLFKLCSTCLSDKSQASLHCGRCDICVVDVDHHCAFVNNCVGVGNRRVFIWFTFWASLGCFFFFLVSIYYQHNSEVYCDHAKGMMWNILAVQQCSILKFPPLFVGTWLAGFTALWIFMILCGQIQMIMSETTTYEVLKKGNSGKFVCGLTSFNTLSKFCATGRYSVRTSTRPSSAPAPSKSVKIKYGDAEAKDFNNRKGTDLV